MCVPAAIQVSVYCIQVNEQKHICIANVALKQRHGSKAACLQSRQHAGPRGQTFAWNNISPLQQLNGRVTKNLRNFELNGQRGGTETTQMAV